MIQGTRCLSPPFALENPHAVRRRDVRTLVGCHNKDTLLGARLKRLTISYANGSPSGSHLPAHANKTLIRCNEYNINSLYSITCIAV
jgi:hypothetical protein